MANASTFEALALELSPAERTDLLDRLQSAFTVSTEPLYARAPAAERRIDYRAAYRELGFFTRIILTIRSLLGGGTKEELVKERYLKSIVKSIEAASVGLIEPKRRVLQEAFYRELATLRGAARYFYDLLDRTLEKNRASFFAFLASLEFESVHDELSTETDPYIFAERNSLATDADIKIAIGSALESAISRIGEDQRRLMYKDVKNLHVLKKLSSFLYDRFLGAFQTNAAGLKEMSLYAASDQLAELAAILSSLDQPPSMKLMEAIIGFAFNDDIGREGFKLEEAVQKELSNAEKALAAIRGFNERVPMEDILKVANEDPNWQCAQTGGGEDWFAIFKSYWRDRVDRRFHRFSAERRVAQLDSDIQALVGKDTPTWFMYLSEAGNEKCPPVRFARSLRLLEAFYHQTFLADINRWLKVVLLEGEFYKRDNRLEFTDAYNEMLQIGDALKKFDSRLSMDGELGLAYAQARSELSSMQIKKRKIESAIKAADIEAEGILAKANDSLGRMKEILKAILSREARGRYDSLSNLGQIDGKANKEFQRGLEATKFKLEKAHFLIGELMLAAVGGADQA
ncbi:MAG: DUF5312 domain-containing protein [Spirochaetes bacterium]|nr:DUF5312 domain-containing protein [Spirochaetota bacterium]MBU1082121.1 DUF5312 domain-containing protein [Spirochaetota bacterium]